MVSVYLLFLKKNIMSLYKRPIKEIKAMCKQDGFVFQNDEIDKILEYYEDHMYDLLVSGEELKIRNIGKISSVPIVIKSNLKDETEEYDTVKFKFTPTHGLKLKAKEKLHSIKARHL